MATLTTKTGRKINIKPKNTSSTTVIDESAWGFSGIYEPPAQQTNYNMESQWDEFLSPVKWDVNYWQSFNYSTGTFANWNKPKWIAPTVSKTSTPSTVSWPSTASNLTKPQSTVMVWWVQKSKYLPETLELRKWDEFWIDKREETPPSFDFNTNLSNLYWKWFTDKSAIFWELSKDKSFAALDSIKQQEYITQMSNNIKDMNEAKAKADMTNEKFDPIEYARQKWFEIQTWDVKEIQKWWKEITDNLKYQGSIYDNNAEDMQFKKEQTIRQLEQNMEQTKIQVNRQIEDVAKQAQQTIDMGEKVGALKGYNKSGWYVQWLMNIQQESMKTIQRLQQDLARAEMLTGEDKALAMQEYDKNMTRAKEEFDYKMRSVVAEWQTELSKMVMWKYDPKKLWEMLDELSYDVIKKRMDIESQYINNIKGANDIITQQFDQYKAMDDYTDNQRKEFTSILNANDWEALASMSAKDIERFVSQGYLSQEQWVAYYQSMVSKTIGALSEYGIPTQDDIDTVINSIKNGLSPLQSVAWVVQSNPNRYSSVKDRFMTVWANSNVFDTVSQQFMTAPWWATWASTTPWYTWPTVQPADPEKLNNAYTKYTSMKNGSVVRWWECWMFVNDYIKSATGINYNMFVDPIDVRKTQTNSQIPSVWSVIVMTSSWTPNATKYWHVGIVTWINADWSINIKDQNWKIKWAVGTQTIAWNDPKIVWYFDPTKWLSAETPISEMDALNFENYVMNFIPTQDRGSDKEKERITNYVQKAMQNGMTAEEAGLAYRWFQIKDKWNIDQAMEYMWILNNLPKFPDWWARIISDFINKWDVIWANRYIANKVDDAVRTRYWTDSVMTANFKNQWNMVNKINTLINNNKWNIGAFDGRIADFKKKFKDTPEIQELDTLLTMLQAETRKNFAGSSVTPSEMTALQDFVWGNKKMNWENLKTMINTIYNKVSNEYNLQRQDYWYSPNQIALDTSKTENILNLARTNQTKPLQTPQQPIQTKQPSNRKASIYSMYGL